MLLLNIQYYNYTASMFPVTDGTFNAKMWIRRLMSSGNKATEYFEDGNNEGKPY